jgi:hypothetical protein
MTKIQRVVYITEQNACIEDDLWMPGSTGCDLTEKL